MLRGVKKQIIEVVNTENEYFEKAILVVSDKYTEYDKLKLNIKAKEYISQINPFPSYKEDGNKKSKDNVLILLNVLKYILVSGVGATIVYFIVR